MNLIPLYQRDKTLNGKDGYNYVLNFCQGVNCGESPGTVVVSGYIYKV